MPTLGIAAAVFQRLVRTVINIDLPSNPDQRDAVIAPASESLFIVAGPGSGKTSVLALRALKVVFVDGLEPNQVLATTFTRRAAKELRSRILGWGDQLRQGLLSSSSLSVPLRTRFSRLDFNAIITGTLDSIAEEILSRTRAPGTQPPAVIEDFAARALMLLRGLFPHQRHNNQNLRNYASILTGSSYGLNPAEIAAIALELRERFLHDFVDVASYRATRLNCRICPQHPHAGIDPLCDAISDYDQFLAGQGVVDYAGVEHAFFLRLQSGALTQFTRDLKVILVDEYQDTNLLQEAIYFSMGQAALANNGSLAVVGDDDQSLYRFRGATVDLFQAFPTRLQAQLHHQARVVFLSGNYRSTRGIVDFCNGYARLDPTFQSARVQGKPPIVFRRGVSSNPPILGFFRNDVNTLARDLAAFIHAVFFGNGYRIPSFGSIRGARDGSVGDCALLVHSPLEVKESYDARTNTVRRRQRLPLLLRQHLGRLTPPIQVFNPRGQHLSSVPEVELLCGLILTCIDPNSTVQQSIATLPRAAVGAFNQWRARADAYIRQNPQPNQPNSLQRFVDAWQRRQAQGRGTWPDEVGLADLAYKLVTWILVMQHDIEGLVRLEVVQRAIAESGRFSSYRGYIDFRSNRYRSSVKAAIRHILVPIALGAVEVDEDLLETLPRDRVNILSIHQSKGLEFPLVFVDVGSDYSRRYARQAFLRYPDDGNRTHRIEDDLRRFSPRYRSGAIRSGRDRAFDDLTRLYYVAISRAQDLLILVGLNGVRNSIENVATGWDRAGNWVWGSGLSNLTHI